jgi:hypothetical protein
MLSYFFPQARRHWTALTFDRPVFLAVTEKQDQFVQRERLQVRDGEYLRKALPERFGL